MRKEILVFRLLILVEREKRKRRKENQIIFLRFPLILILLYWSINKEDNRTRSLGNGTEQLMYQGKMIENRKYI
jgi:hypothetical protein